MPEIKRNYIARDIVFSYNNVNEAKADRSLTIGDTVSTLGYYSPNDGGAAEYVVVAGGTGTDDGGTYVNLDNGNQLFLINNGEVSAKQYGASPNQSDNTNFIQNALNTGKTVYLPDGIYDISTGITSSTEGQIFYGNGNSSVIRATADIIMFEHITERYQQIQNIRLNGNNLASYGYKCSFPKCGMINAQADSCNSAGAWLAHFSTFIDEHSRVINNNSIGVLIQDDVGQTNDVRVSASIVSGNAAHGIRIATPARDGILINGLNMENNCSTAGFSHVSSVNLKSLHITDIYMENSLNTDAANLFFDFDSSIEMLTLDRIKMNDSASTTPFDYFIYVANNGGDLLRKGLFSNIWADGYGQKLIQNGMNTGVNNYLGLQNIFVEADADIASSGTALDILSPKRSTMLGRRVTSNQTFTTATNAIFNEAMDTTTQSVVDSRLSPAAYDLATGDYTVFESGRYRVSGVLSFTGAGVAAGEYATISILKNAGIEFGPFYSQRSDASKNFSGSFGGTIECNSGDILAVQIAASSGSIDMRIIGSSITIEKVGTSYGQNS